MRLIRSAAVALFVACCLLGRPASVIADTHAAKTFVLVHGTWVGEWYWSPLAQRLEDDGHRVHAVSLKGHGKRATENGPDVTLEDHIDDIVDAIESNELTHVYLVSHSYGGRPATGAWDRARERIHHVVYVDAIAPVNDSDTPIPADDEVLATLKKQYPQVAETGMLPVRPQIDESMRARSTPQSINTLYASVTLQAGPLPTTTKRTFVAATRNRSPYFRATAKRLREDGRWTVLELDSGHNVVEEGLDELTDILESLE